MSTENSTPEPRSTRCENWPERLFEFLQKREGTPFDWAAHNCCLFAADWVLELTGYDPAAELRGKLKTPKQALKYMRAHGGVEGLIAKHLLTHGWAEVGRTYAQRGDLVTHQCEEQWGGTGLGICTGPLLAAVSNDGLITKPMSAALRAWHID